MKKILTLAAAALCLAACIKTNSPAEQVTTLTASLESGVTKTHLSVEDGIGKVLWDANDQICVFSQETGEYRCTVFSTAEGGGTALFKGPGITLDAKVAAIYPAFEAVSYTEADGILFEVDNTTQKVLDGTFDQQLNIAAGQWTGEKNLSFRNVGALLSFKLTQERADTIRRIELKSNDGTPLCFSGAASVKWVDGAPVITPAAETSDVVKIVPAGETFQTGETYYVWLLSGQHAAGITLTMISPTQMTAAKVGASALELERNQLVDLGEIGGIEWKAKETEKKALHFDFSGTPLEGWPTTDKWKEAPGELACYYPLDDVNYEFFLTDVGNGTQARVCWDPGKGGLVWYAGWRYLGLPAIEGFRLIKVSGVMCLGTNSKRKAAIVENVAETNVETTIDAAHTFVQGGESAGWTTSGETYTFNLEGTQPNTRYYLLCSATSIGVSSLDLVYEKVE